MYRKKSMNNLSHSKRIYFLIMLITAFFVIFIVKLVEYQLLNADYYDKLAEHKNKIKQIIPAARGDIIDCNGVLLATSQLKLSLIIDSTFPMPSLKDNATSAKAKNKQGNLVLYNLIKILENNNLQFNSKFPITTTAPYNFLEDKKLEETKLKTALNQQPYATPVDILNLLVEKYNIEGYNENDTVKIAELRANMLISDFQNTKIFKIIDSIDSKYIENFIGTKKHLQGVSIMETSERLYPCEHIGAHIIGNVGPIYADELEKLKNKNYENDAIIGKYGIEKEFEDSLRPFNGLLTIETLKNGEIKRSYAKDEQPKPGKTVRLTIDFEFQKKIQEAFETYANSNSSSKKGGAVVVLNTDNGEILSINTTPTYSLNTYYENYDTLSKSSNKPLLNQALSTFRPGSTFKIFIAAAALLSGKITPNTTFRCCPGKVLFPNMTCYQLRHKFANRNISLLEAIQNSCNNYFYATAKAMSIETIDEYAPYFGLATDTGLEIFNPDGRVTNPATYAKRGIPYQQGFTWQTGIGQADVYITPLQMAIMTMVIANYGKRYNAHIVKAIESFDGKTTFFKTKPKIISQLNSKSVAWPTVLEGMKRMAQTKHTYPKLNGSIVAKSGTPEYSDTDHNKTNSAGVGIYYDKNKNPKLAMSVFVRDGKQADDFLGKIAAIYEELELKRNSN